MKINKMIPIMIIKLAKTQTLNKFQWIKRFITKNIVEQSNIFKGDHQISHNKLIQIKSFLKNLKGFPHNL